MDYRFATSPSNFQSKLSARSSCLMQETSGHSLQTNHIPCEIIRKERVDKSGNLRFKAVSRTNSFRSTNHSRFATYHGCHSMARPICTHRLPGGVLYKPIAMNWNAIWIRFAIQKIREGVSLQLRSGLFNVFNHTNLANSSVGTSSSSTFGPITSTRSNPSTPGISYRKLPSVRLAGKIIF